MLPDSGCHAPVFRYLPIVDSCRCLHLASGIVAVASVADVRCGIQVGVGSAHWSRFVATIVLHGTSSQAYTRFDISSRQTLLLEGVMSQLRVAVWRCKVRMLDQSMRRRVTVEVGANHVDPASPHRACGLRSSTIFRAGRDPPNVACAKLLSDADGGRVGRRVCVVAVDDRR